jgi:mRNA interferase HicA
LFTFPNDNQQGTEARWLAKQGATFKPGKGSHWRVFLNGRQSVLPMHGGEMKTGTVEAIKKQLGLK